MNMIPAELPRATAAQAQLIHALEEYLAYQERETYAIEDRERERNARYRAWYVAGKPIALEPHEHKPRYKRDDIEEADRLAFIGPRDKWVSLPESVNFTSDAHGDRTYRADYSTQGSLNEEARHQQAIHEALVAFYATPEGQAHLKGINREIARDQQRQDDVAAVKRHILRTRPWRFKLTEAQAQAELARTKPKKDPWHLHDDERSLRDICRKKPELASSLEEAKLWKAQSEGYTLPYLEYRELCEKASQRPPSLLQYRKLQRQSRKSQQKTRKATPRQSQA